MNEFAQAGQRDASGRGPDLRLLFVRGMSRSLLWVLLLILIGAAVGLGLGLMQPNSYVSTGKLILRMGAREKLSSESLIDFDQRQDTPTPTMADELQLLADVAIFERVALAIGPRVVLQPADPTRDDGPSTFAPVHLMHALQAYIFRRLPEPEPRAGESELLLATKLLRENSSVKNEPGSSVILVSNTSSSPELARDTVQALVRAFVERHREQFSIQSLLEKSRAQLEQARASRDQAAAEYVEKMSQSGIGELENQVPRLELEMRGLETDLFAARMRQAEIGRLTTLLSSRLQGIPVEVEIQHATVMIVNEEYETQLGLKRALLAQKQAMLIANRPGEEARRLEREFDKQIAAVEERIRATPKAVPQGSEMQENLGHSALQARIADLEVEGAALPARLVLLASQLELKKSGLSQIQKQLFSATTLRKDLAVARDSAESRFAHLVDRLSVLEALQDIDADGGANLRVLQVPTLERERVGPKRLSLLLKGLLAGIVAATALTLLRQRFDRRLRYPDSFEHARDVPVLAVVPHLSALRRLKQRAPLAGS